MRNEILNSLNWYEVMEIPQAYNCIYVWRNKVNGKTYVGQAKDLHKRRNQHIANKDRLDFYFYNSLRKRGIEGYQIAVIIENIETQEEIDDKEIYYIEILNSLNKNNKGYNCAKGGNGGNNFEGKTEEEMKETRQKMSESRKGKLHSEEHKQKLSESHKGKYPSEETRQKLSESHKGIQISEETKQKMSESHKRKPIIGINIKTNEMIEFISSCEAQRNGFDRPAISKCCNNKFHRQGNNVYKGYKWYYKEDYIKLFGEL